MLIHEAPAGMFVEEFQIDSVSTSEREYQGHQAQEVWGSYAPSRPAELPPGTVMVPMDQPLARVVFTLLEPSSDDGVVAWGLISESLGAGRPYPILRAVQADDPGLSFAPNPNDRSCFFLIPRPMPKTEDITMRRFGFLAILFLPGLLACQGGVPVEEAVASINEADFLRKIGVIAHDSMMGRANPSPGLDMTAQWIAEEFKRYGLKPGGDNGSYIQNYHMREIRSGLRRLFGPGHRWP